MIYYIETNLVAFAVLVLILLRGGKLTSRHETSQLIFNYMLWDSMLLCLSDIAAFYFRGKSYIGIEFSNMLYFLSMAVGAYLWLLFICVKLEYTGSLKKTALLSSLPVLALILMTVLNPFTGFVFTVDDDLLYHRGFGVVVSWLVEWGYLLAALILNIKKLFSEKRGYRRQEYRGYLSFVLPITLSGIIQMAFYGTTVTQVGFMLAILMVEMNKQHHQVQRDGLTELNNKNSLLHYKDTLTPGFRDVDITIFFMDIDSFKSINDTFGHLKGDKALRDIADVLKETADSYPEKRLFIARYAGDEFVVVGSDMQKADIESFIRCVREKTEVKNQRNKEAGEDYSLSLSIGIATGTCTDAVTFDRLFEYADADMYRVKGAKERITRKIKE